MKETIKEALNRAWAKARMRQQEFVAARGVPAMRFRVQETNLCSMLDSLEETGDALAWMSSLSPVQLSWLRISVDEEEKRVRLELAGVTDVGRRIEAIRAQRGPVWRL